MTAKPASYNKHANFIAKNGEVFPEKEPGVLGSISEALFGKYNSDFEQRVQ